MPNSCLALADGIGQNSVNANDGKQECCCGKSADEQHGETGLRARSVDKLFGGLNFIYRLIAVNSSDLGAHRRRWLPPGEYQFAPAGSCHSTEAAETADRVGLRFFFEALILDVRSDADDQRGYRPAADHDLLYRLRDWPGQNWRANDSFTTTTAGAAALSSLVNVRPARMGTRMVSNHRGLMASISMKGAEQAEHPAGPLEEPA